MPFSPWALQSREVALPSALPPARSPWQTGEERLLLPGPCPQGQDWCTALLPCFITRGINNPAHWAEGPGASMAAFHG